MVTAKEGTPPRSGGHRVRVTESRSQSWGHGVTEAGSQSWGHGVRVTESGSWSWGHGVGLLGSVREADAHETDELY